VIQTLIETAKDEIDALAYDESKTLDENKAAVDAIVSKLENDIAEHRKKYTATFIADGKTVDEITFTIDTDSITEPEVPFKEGNTGVWEEYTLGSEDITVNAVYTPNDYTITYVIDGNETEVKYNFGASVDKPADPVKDGFNFIGWDEEIPATMPAENLTITAEFEIIPTEPTPTEPTPTEPTPTEPTPTEPTPTEPTPTEPTPTEPTPTEPTPTEPTPTDTEPAHEHNYKGEVTTKPTCTQDGIMTYTCECGETYTQVIPKTGHKQGAWEVVTPATTEVAGKEVKKCTVCEEVLAEREIAKLEPQETDAGIVGVNLEKLNDYGIANAFGVDPEKLPAGSTVTWYVNGEKAGEGNGFRVDNPTEDYTIKAVVTNRDGKVIGETEEVTVKVNNSFFARIYYWLCRIIQKVIDFFKK
jgi:cell division septation protein DedD